jgi:hypothetical protein
MKKMRILGTTLSLAIALIAFVLGVFFTQGAVAYAEGLSKAQTFESLFMDKEIEATGYLYNYDESADYIYIYFKGFTGYAIFTEETLELLEYSAVGDFPFMTVESKKYYGGPRAYFSKSGELFVNTITNEQISVDEAEIIAQSNRQSFSIEATSTVESETLGDVQIDKLQNALSQKFVDGTSKNLTKGPFNSPYNAPTNPPLDENNWISPTAGATYITNSAYFLTSGAAPRHGANNGTSCTAVATQLMLSYNNYYNDRRIIDNQYLYGTSIVNPERNPNFCADPLSKTSYTLGSTQALHDLLFNNNVTGHLNVAQTGLRTYLDGRIGSNNYIVNSVNSWPNSLPTAGVLSELNANRPLVLATEETLNGTQLGSDAPRPFNYSVIAYGYQTFAAYASSGDPTVYTGYIVHMGWDTNGNGSNINIWTNSAWYYSSLSLETTHTHSHAVTNTTYNNGFDVISQCAECGHRTGQALPRITYDANGGSGTISQQEYIRHWVRLLAMRQD